VYSRALARGNQADADRIAGAIGVLLGLAVSVLVLLGVLFTPALVSVIAAGFDGEKRELTIRLTRILFPGAGLLVFGAWCLGILNSHKRFFLSYAAPVAWNLAMIAALLFYRQDAPLPLSVKVAWASVVGSALLVLVQLPVVFRVASLMRPSFGRGNAEVRTVVRNFTPAFVGRGVVQISAYVDQIIASFLATGSVALLGYSRTLVMLPISLFAMSVSAAELPAMSGTQDDQLADHVRARLKTGLRRIAFFVIPSGVAFLVLGDVMATALFQSGRFTARDTQFTWGILAAASVGLLATSLARLYSSAFYALHDTKSPLRMALARVTIAAGLGVLAGVYAPRILGIESQWGAAGLALASSIAGWVEFLLLRGRLNERIGQTGLAGSLTLRLFVAAAIAGAAGYGAKLLVLQTHRFAVAVVSLGVFGLVYLALTYVFGVAEASAMIRRVRGNRT
jgi:putative peptidoglycan lipid II flippase